MPRRRSAVGALGDGPRPGCGGGLPPVERLPSAADTSASTAALAETAVELARRVWSP
ncbi:MAG: hypothetical protein ACLTEX_03195 [Eggerthella lenta]